MGAGKRGGGGRCEARSSVLLLVRLVCPVFSSCRCTRSIEIAAPVCIQPVLQEKYKQHIPTSEYTDSHALPPKPRQSLPRPRRSSRKIIAQLARGFLEPRRCERRV